MKRKTDNFSKFFNRKSNSAIKEAIKQEKKTEKKERKEAIERHFEKKRLAKAARAGYNQAEPGRNQAGTPPPGKFRKGGAPGAPVTSGSSRPAKDHKEHQDHQDHGGQPRRDQSRDAGQLPGQGGHLIPLNKYIAHGGLCSRRDAAELIRLGKVTVNGNPVTEPGTKVSPADLVKVNGKKVTISRNFVYILLNKPKDYITTTDDPQGRKTVLDLIRHATTERVYPVGRLDRNTSGVLLLTNDGELAQKLAHPKHEIKKIYHVTLDKALTKADFDKIISGGVILDDGPAFVDVIAYADARDKTQIGLEIHSGRNRIVRRIFEHLGYDVRGLDRVMYAGLTKKNVQRGKWRLLTEKEVRIMKYLNSSVKASASNKGAAQERRDSTQDGAGRNFQQDRTSRHDDGQDVADLFEDFSDSDAPANDVPDKAVSREVATRDKGFSRDKGADRDRGPARGKGTDLSKDTDRDKGPARGKGTAQGKGIAPDKRFPRNKDYAQNKATRDKGFTHSKDAAHDKDATRDKGFSRDRGFSRDKGADRDKHPDRSKGTDRDKSPDRDKGFSRDRPDARETAPHGARIGKSRRPGTSGRTAAKPSGKRPPAPGSSRNRNHGPKKHDLKTTRSARKAQNTGQSEGRSTDAGRGAAPNDRSNPKAKGRNPKSKDRNTKSNSSYPKSNSSNQKSRGRNPK